MRGTLCLYYFISLCFNGSHLLHSLHPPLLAKDDLFIMFFLFLLVVENITFLALENLLKRCQEHAYYIPDNIQNEISLEPVKNNYCKQYVSFKHNFL